MKHRRSSPTAIIAGLALFFSLTAGALAAVSGGTSNGARMGDAKVANAIALPSNVTAPAPAGTGFATPAAASKTNLDGKGKGKAKKTKIVYLTFDDGPGGSYTLQVLADLKAAGAHATFFENGDDTTIGALGGVPDGSSYPTSGMNAGYPLNAGIPLQILAAGDQLGTHSWDHPDFSKITTAAATDAEIQNARDLQIKLTTSPQYPHGYDSKLFRYPFDTASTLGDTYLQSQGMKAVSYNIAPDDWCFTTTCVTDSGALGPVTDAEVISQVMSTVSNGAIVDLHDATDVLDRKAPTYLPTLLADLSAAGYATANIPSVQ
jgi:peptidoglycan-N-acetylglucosamine deacetylase